MTGRWGRGRTDTHSTAQHSRPGGRSALDRGASQIMVIGIIIITITTITTIIITAITATTTTPRASPAQPPFSSP